MEENSKLGWVLEPYNISCLALVGNIHIMYIYIYIEIVCVYIHIYICSTYGIIRVWSVTLNNCSQEYPRAKKIAEMPDRSQAQQHPQLPPQDTVDFCFTRQRFSWILSYCDEATGSAHGRVSDFSDLEKLSANLSCGKAAAERRSSTLVTFLYPQFPRVLVCASSARKTILKRSDVRGLLQCNIP